MNFERPWDFNFCCGLSWAEIDKLFKDLTPTQRIGLEAVLKEAPCGLVAIYGCAKAGKTITLYAALNAILTQGQKVLVASLTSEAMNNICTRFGGVDMEDKFPKIYVHLEQFELFEIWKYDPLKSAPKNWTSTRHRKRFEKFGREHSLACNILKVAGCLSNIPRI
jgi:hypothetical protein